MVPLAVLVISFAALRCAGMLGIAALDNWDLPLRGALSTMFLLTGSAHWGRRRPDLIRMVPQAFPSPPTIVSVTGILELLGAVGLLIPFTARLAAACLAVLLAAMFPANMRAARERLTILGRPAMGIPGRGAIQVVFVGALVAAAIGRR
jgi:uncharacterized membrane protein